MKTPTQSHDEFVAMLNKLLGQIRERATNQYEYNLNTNVPSKILTLDESAEQAVNHGFIAAFNQVNGWDCSKAIRIAYDVMEDANAHDACRELKKFIPEFN